MIVGLNPRTEGNLVQVLGGSVQFHVIADARFLEVEHEVGCSEQFASLAVKEWRTLAGELLENRFVFNRAFRIADTQR